MPVTGTPLLWAVFAAFVVVALAVDFLVLNRRGDRPVSMRAATIWSLVWIGVAFVFVAGLWWHLGGPGDPVADAKALEFVTGYLIEKALAVDNLFVFLMLFTFFGIAPSQQRRALMIGIVGALVLRAIMILIGAWLIAQFHWILYVFGAFLVFTGVKMWLASGEEPDLENNRLIGWLQRRLRVKADYAGDAMTVRENGVLHATPMLLVVIMIGIIDVVFAVDSIPAIFAVTTDPFIVLTSNVFAILGLRAMYFLLAGLKERFHLLSYGLAVVLVFIGTKMLLLDLVKIPIWVSLGVTVVVLAATMVLSLRIAPKAGGGGGAYPFEPRRRDGARHGGRHGG